MSTAYRELTVKTSYALSLTYSSSLKEIGGGGGGGKRILPNPEFTFPLMPYDDMDCCTIFSAIGQAETPQKLCYLILN